MKPYTASKITGFESIAELGALMRRQDLSPIELVTSCLERIKRMQPRINAFITVTSDSALQAAKTAEREIQQGNWRGPLHGIPIAIKDFYDTAGIRTTAAFELFRNRIPGKDAAAVERLKTAGAIIVGKMNMHSLGMGTTGLESCFGPVRNPWNPDYIPGGSSSGSAAAVASGLCYATLDTDAIGSCRLPAACCGVVGFKGTYGLINMQGILAGEKSPDEELVWMAHAGISTRTVEDTTVVLDVLAERPPGEPASYPLCLRQQRQLRIGIAGNYKAEREVQETFEKAVGIIRRLGYPMSQVIAPLTDFSRGIVNIVSDRKGIARQSFNDVDLLLLPTATATLRARDAENPLALSPENTMFANYYGLPAVSVPCGFEKNGVPLGLQIVGKPWDEGAVLRLAYQFQAATGRSNRPPAA